MRQQIGKTSLMLDVSQLLKERSKSHAMAAQQRKTIDDYKLRCSEFGGPLSAIELTMDEVVSELELPSTMPSESGPRRYLFYGKVWSPKAKFQVDFKVPQAVPLSKKALETTTTILSKWFAPRPIPRKRKRTAA